MQNEQITKMQTEIESLEEKIESLSQPLSAIEKKISQQEAELKPLVEQLKALESQRKQLGIFKGKEKKEIDAQISPIKTKIDEQEEKIKKSKGDAYSLSKQQSEAKNEIKRIQNAIEELLKEEALIREASQGNPQAAFDLGNHFCSPKKQDYNKAAEWFNKAAELGVSEAQYRIGQMLSVGQGVQQDSIKAAEWFRKAAELGNAEAQYSFGKMLVDGQGVQQDSIKAAEWFRKAAELGNAKAQYSFGKMLIDGQGVPQDKNEAKEWYNKAAIQGNAEAQYSLGKIIMQEDCLSDELTEVKNGYQKAKVWFDRAANQGNDNARRFSKLISLVSGQLESYAYIHEWALDVVKEMCYVLIEDGYEFGDAKVKDSLGSISIYSKEKSYLGKISVGKNMYDHVAMYAFLSLPRSADPWVIINANLAIVVESQLSSSSKEPPEWLMQCARVFAKSEYKFVDPDWFYQVKSSNTQTIHAWIHENKGCLT